MPDHSFLDTKYFIDNEIYNCPFCNRRHVKYSLLSREEFDFLRSKTTLVRNLGMEANRICAVTAAGDRMEEVDFRGVTANIAVINNTQTELGRFISESDDARHLAVVFIGSEVKERFFPNVDPIGKQLQLNGRPFEVIGVAKQQGSVFGQSRDKFVMIPIELYS